MLDLFIAELQDGAETKDILHDLASALELAAQEYATDDNITMSNHVQGEASRIRELADTLAIV